MSNRLFLVSRFICLILVVSKGRTVMLLAQKSKPVVSGRKRKKHELAPLVKPADERMQYEERKDEEVEGEPAGHQSGAQPPNRGKRNRTQIMGDGI